MDWDEFVAMLPEPHTITVEPFLGAGAYGDQYGPAVEIDRCYVEARRKRVRIATQDAAGAVVISSTQVYCPPDTVAPPQSRVTLPSGAVALVLDAADFDAAGLALPEHVALSLE